jgi:mono/diheme cytochrome c family protein
MKLKSALLLLVIGVAVAGGFLFVLRKEAGNPASGAAMVQVTVPTFSGEANEGETVFNENCATCHGKNAAGKDGSGPPLIHKIYEPSHHADGSFLLAVKQGVRAHHWPFGNMPPIKGLTEDEVARIVAYIRTLQQANGIL